MAFEDPGKTITLEAGQDLSSDQYKLVTLASDGQVDVTTSQSVGDSTDTPIGILQNKPSAAGVAAEVMVSGISKVIAGETVAIGDLITASTVADGRVDTAGASTDVIIGMAVTGGDVGETISVLLFGGPGGEVS